MFDFFLLDYMFQFHNFVQMKVQGALRWFLARWVSARLQKQGKNSQQDIELFPVARDKLVHNKFLRRTAGESTAVQLRILCC